jgi:hypothetical protein
MPARDLWVYQRCILAASGLRRPTGVCEHRNSTGRRPCNMVVQVPFALMDTKARLQQSCMAMHGKLKVQL